MSAGFIIVVGGLTGAAIGVVLFGIWFNWWADKQTYSVWASKGEFNLHLIEQIEKGGKK